MVSDSSRWPLFLEFLNKECSGKIQRTAALVKLFGFMSNCLQNIVYKDNDNELIRYASPINEPHYIFL